MTRSFLREIPPQLNFYNCSRERLAACLAASMHAQAQLPRDEEAEPRDAQAEADPLADLESFFEKQLVIVGGFGASGQGPAGGKAQQWRSMWDAFKQYGDGGDPAKEEIERARGCNHYCGDCHALTMATASGTPQWSQLQFGPEAHELMLVRVRVRVRLTLTLTSALTLTLTRRTS